MKDKIKCTEKYPYNFSNIYSILRRKNISYSVILVGR